MDSEHNFVRFAIQSQPERTLQFGEKKRLPRSPLGVQPDRDGHGHARLAQHLGQRARVQVVAQQVLVLLHVQPPRAKQLAEYRLLVLGVHVVRRLALRVRTVEQLAVLRVPQQDLHYRFLTS